MIDLKNSLAKYFNREYVLNNIYIALQKNSKQNIVKRYDFEGIESYLYILIKKFYLKISKDELIYLNITEDEAWKYAEINTFKNSRIVTVEEALGLEKEENNNPEMLVLTNKSKINGASTALNQRQIKEVMKQYNVKKAVLIPSSIHEMLLLFLDEKKEKETLVLIQQTIKEINRDFVSEEEQLSEKYYLINL